jgi:hypothetical protein
VGWLIHDVRGQNLWCDSGCGGLIIRRSLLPPSRRPCIPGGLLHSVQPRTRGQPAEAPWRLALVYILPLAESAPARLATVPTPAWKDRYGTPFSDYRLPKGETEREKLAEQIGADGVILWGAASAASSPVTRAARATLGWLKPACSMCSLRRPSTSSGSRQPGPPAPAMLAKRGAWRLAPCTPFCVVSRLSA